MTGRGALLAVLAVALSGCGEALPPVRPHADVVVPETVRPGQRSAVWGDHLGTGGGLTLAGTALAPSSWSEYRVEFQVPRELEEGDRELVVSAGGRALQPLVLKVVPLPPVLGGVQPARARVGDVIALSGKHFGKQARGGGVRYHGAAATVVSWSDERIEVRVPRPATGGDVAVTTHAGETSNALPHELIVPAPGAVEPRGALPGRTVVVRGEAFGATPGRVRVGAAVARVLRWSETAIELQVPEVASGAGLPLVVENENGVGPAVPVDVHAPAPEGDVWASGPQSRDLSMTLDARDFPHACWYDGRTRAAMLVRWNGLSWERELVRPPAPAAGGDSGWHPSLWTEPDGSEHLTCYDLNDALLLYAAFHAEGPAHWSFEYPAPEARDAGLSSCVCVDGHGRVAIAYCDQAQGRLMLARGRPGAWELTAVDPAARAGFPASLALDAEGNPHVAYVDLTASAVKYARWDGGKFVVETVAGREAGEAPASFGPSDPQLVLDAAGAPHVAWIGRRGEPAAGPLRVAARREGRWEPASVAGGESAGPPSLAVVHDHPVIGFVDARARAARLARPGAGGWSAQAVPGLPDPGALLVAAGHDGRAHLLAWKDAAGPHTIIHKVLETSKE